MLRRSKMAKRSGVQGFISTLRKESAVKGGRTVDLLG
jgi:hypothetical protein